MQLDISLRSVHMLDHDAVTSAVLLAVAMIGLNMDHPLIVLDGIPEELMQSRNHVNANAGTVAAFDASSYAQQAS